MTDIRTVPTTAGALGFPGGSTLEVDRIHVRDSGRIEDAIDTYRRIFGLTPDSSVTVRSTPHRRVVDMDPNGMTLVRRPNLSRTTSSEMVIGP